MVAEGEVLLGIEHLEQGRRGIAPEVGPDLVDLVHHEDGVVGPGAPDALDDPTRHGPDVGAAVSSDLGLVADSAQRHPDELPSQGAGDAPAEGRLAHAGRTDEAEDGPLDLLGEGADGQVLEDALLDLHQPVVVFIQDLLGFPQVEIIHRALVPGDREHPVEVVADDGRLGRLGMHLGQPADLRLELLPDLLGDLERDELVLVGFDLLLELGPLPQFLLDGLHLLPQEVLALELVHLSLGLGADLGLHVQELELFGQELIDPLQTVSRVYDLQDLVGLVHREFDGNGADVLLQALELPAAGNRNNPGLLREQPGQRELSRRRPLLFCHLAKQIK